MTSSRTMTQDLASLSAVMAETSRILCAFGGKLFGVESEVIRTVQDLSKFLFFAPHLSPPRF
jgi:hypothetical protein